MISNSKIPLLFDALLKLASFDIDTNNVNIWFYIIFICMILVDLWFQYQSGHLFVSFIFMCDTQFIWTQQIYYLKCGEVFL